MVHAVGAGQRVVPQAARDGAEAGDRGRDSRRHGRARRQIDADRGRKGRVIKLVRAAGSAVQSAGKRRPVLERKDIVAAAPADLVDPFDVVERTGDVRDRDRAVGLDRHGQVGRDRGKVERIDTLDPVIRDCVGAPAVRELERVRPFAAGQLVIAARADQQVVAGAADRVLHITDRRGHDCSHDGRALEYAARAAAGQAQIRGGRTAVQAGHCEVAGTAARIVEEDAVARRMDDRRQPRWSGRLDRGEDLGHRRRIAKVDFHGRAVAQRNPQVVDQRPPAQHIPGARSGETQVRGRRRTGQVRDGQVSAADRRVAQVDAVARVVQLGVDPRVRAVDGLDRVCDRFGAAQGDLDRRAIAQGDPQIVDQRLTVQPAARRVAREPQIRRRRRAVQIVDRQVLVAARRIAQIDAVARRVDRGRQSAVGRLDRVQHVADGLRVGEVDNRRGPIGQGDSQLAGNAQAVVQARQKCAAGQGEQSRTDTRAAVQTAQRRVHRKGGLADARAVVEIADRHVGGQPDHRPATDKAADLGHAGRQVREYRSPAGGVVQRIRPAAAVDGSAEVPRERERVVARAADQRLDTGERVHAVEHTASQPVENPVGVGVRARQRAASGSPGEQNAADHGRHARVDGQGHVERIPIDPHARRDLVQGRGSQDGC